MNPTFTTRWLYANLEQKQVELGPYACAVCGLPTKQHTLLKKVIRPTFTDHAVLRQPTNDKACPACDWYMSRQDVRRQSWWLTEHKAQPLAKNEIYNLLAEHLTTPPAADGYYLITTMKRKHLALHAPLNSAHNPQRRIRFEVNTLDLDPEFLDLAAAAFALRRRHSWREIQNDDYIPAFISRWPDPSAWLKHRSTLQPFLYTPYLDLCQFIWHKEMNT